MGRAVWRAAAQSALLTQQQLFQASALKIERMVNASESRPMTHLSNRRDTYPKCGKAIELSDPQRHVAVADGFVEDAYLTTLCSLVANSQLQHIVSSPGERKLVVDANSLCLAEEVLGSKPIAMLSRLRSELADFLRAHCEYETQEAGAILSWLSPFQTSDKSLYRYTDPHVDKANNFEYDVGCLLYLNSDFTGGDFVFMDEDKDYIVQPKSGRVLLFSSSIENVHRVEQVTRGNRMLLSVWHSVKQRSKPGDRQVDRPT